MKYQRHIITAAITLAVCCLGSTSSEAKKPVNPGGGGGGKDQEPPAYELIDLLGFDNGSLGYQSGAQFITNRDVDGRVLVYGTSFERYSDRPWQNYPALWQVDLDGNFPEPQNLGLPEFALEVEPTGINSHGVAVGWTRRVEAPDENGNWNFPSWVDVPERPYQQLPYFVDPNTEANAINDAGVIVGRLAVEDPQSPSGMRAVGAMWMVNADGTVSDPVSLGDFYPEDINNSGVMAGRHAESGYPAIAWFEDELLVVKQLETTDPRYLWADVNALNDFAPGDERLLVVGESYEDNAGEAFVWRPFDEAEPSTLLGKLGGSSSAALDVNKRGEIVGWSDTKKHGQQAFVYRDGVLQNLNSLVDVGQNTLHWAYGINDEGDIVGFMGVPRPVSEARGYLVRPIEPN